SNTMRSMKPMATPRATSRATLSTIAASKPCQAGGAGSSGDRARLIASAAITRTRAGTARVPITGIAIRSAPTRSATQSRVEIMPNICWPSTTTWVAESISAGPGRGARSADQVRDAVEQRGGVLHQVTEQEGAQREHGRGQRRGLGHEGDGGLVDLGGGLEHAHHHAHDQHGEQQRAADPERDLESAAQLGEGEFGS